MQRMLDPVRREDVLMALDGTKFSALTKETRTAVSVAHRQPFVEECDFGDLVWTFSRGPRAEVGLALIRFRPGWRVRGFLFRSGEGEHQGPVAIEDGMLLLLAEKPAGDVFNMITGLRVPRPGTLQTT